MNPKCLYRLKDYRICQLTNDRLWWETHSGFGSQISGPCYTWDDILLIGAKRNKEIGFLKSEFLDSLRKLPCWRKTRYYCFATAMLDVNTGQVVNEDQLAQNILLKGKSVGAAETSYSRESGSFRLGRCQIIVTADDRISWKSSGGAYQMISGPAFIESDVLFFGSGQIDDEKISKRDFLSMLRKLPEWDQTILWCRSLALKTVSKEERPTLSLSFRENETFSRRGVTSAGRRHRDYSKRLWSRMVHFHHGCIDKIRTRWPQNGLAERIRKFRKK